VRCGTRQERWDSGSRAGFSIKKAGSSFQLYFHCTPETIVAPMNGNSRLGAIIHAAAAGFVAGSQLDLPAAFARAQSLLF
jgi:hypothetical protein